jgi:glycine hydroxymethyltransferase
MTTRGLKENDMIKIANIIDLALRNYRNEIVLDILKNQVLDMVAGKPLFSY